MTSRNFTPQYARTTYVHGLLDIAHALEGERNCTVYRVAIRAAEFVAVGLLDEDVVRADIRKYAKLSGLGTYEIDKTVGSAFGRIARRSRAA